jgi:photosynthetic reaction center cytochrome c subunit
MKTWMYYAVAFSVVAFVGLLFTFERPPQVAVQTGYRGLAMEQVYNVRRVEEQVAATRIPDPLPPVEPDGPLASEVYENVQVLGDLTEVEFTNLMVAITEWVSPQQGCAYCHGEEGNFASDDYYTKTVSRRMIQMTRTINVNWESHVGQTGVTCYTCHRGQPVPSAIWFEDPGVRTARGLLGNNAGQNQAAPNVGLTSLPVDPYSVFLSGAGAANPIRNIGTTALPTGNLSSTKQAEWTYALMIHMSEALGVNCTYCHNSRAFAQWDQSPPTRATAWHGIRMVQQLNGEYLEPLQPVYPDVRLGPLGDAPKANCETCHQGAYRPLYGVNMLQNHPELDRLGTQQRSSAAPATPSSTASASEAATVR